MASLSNRLAANKRFEFTSKAYGEDKFAVVNMEGYESISRPFRFELTLVSDDADIDFDKMLEQPASFRIFTPDGALSTPYFGSLAEFDQLHKSDGYVFYRAVLVPRIWQLSLYRVSEVYLEEKPIPALIKKVLEAAHFSTQDFEFKTSGVYRDRSFVCQYQESHLDFLSRWMEKEGMYYWFEHDGKEKKDRLIIADNKTMHDASVVAVNYRPADEPDTGTASNSVQTFTCRQKPLPKQVILQDYNHRKASTQLRATASVAEKGVGDVMMYGENFRDNQEGERYAKLRAEEIICGGRVFSGESTAVGLRSGYFLQLTHHYRDAFNGKYLVTEIEHRGSQAGALLNGIHSPFSHGNEATDTSYGNSFRAIAADIQFRPERVTQKPRVAGTMNATIDSEGSGEYAELDEYGQYKVQLPFDQSDKKANHGSARVRMATPYSGSNHGMHFPLHKNAEVLLSFTDGDPDQPVIVGAVPNSENRSVVGTGAAHENRISTAGGNQIYMRDTKGKEVMWLHSPFHNSTIGIGSIDPKGGGSLWASTAGSSESVTVGTTNSIFAGEKNSLTLSAETSVAATFATKIALGTNVNFSVGQDVAWKFGRSITLDESESIALKETSKLQGNKEVVISGQMNATVKSLADSFKNKIRVVVGLNAAANLAIGGGAAAHVHKNADDKGKVDPQSGENFKIAGIYGALNTLNAGLTHAVLRSAAISMAATLKAENAYSNNIRLNDKGIGISSRTAVKVAAGDKTYMDLDWFNINMGTGGDHGTSIKQDGFDINLNRGEGITASSLKMGLRIEAKSATGINLEYASKSFGATLAMDSSGFVAKQKDGRTLDLGYTSAKLEYEKGKGFEASRTEVKASLGSSAMSLGTTDATLKAGDTKLNVGPAGATVNGKMIRLG